MEQKSGFSLSKRKMLVVSLLLIFICEGELGVVITVQEASQSYDLENHSKSNERNIEGTGAHNTSFLKFENADTDDYPYDQLLEIVKKTKELISSKNTTETQRVLSIDPWYYDIYLKGAPNRFIQSSGTAYADVSFSNECNVETKIIYPKKLKGIDGKNYYILNVGSEFVQKFYSNVCREPGRHCGRAADLPENRVTVCVQSYGTVRHFFSVPVKKRLNLSDQNIFPFKIPEECICKRVRPY